MGVHIHVHHGLGREMCICWIDLWVDTSCTHRSFTSVGTALGLVQLLSCTYVEYVSMWYFCLVIVQLGYAISSWIVYSSLNDR
jgi:hypothetical protein